MNKPRRLPILSSLLMLAVALAVSAAATASFPGTVSAQAYPEFLVENVRAEGSANQLVITWEPPQVAKDHTVGTGDAATTIERRTGVSRYVFRFEDRPAESRTPINQGGTVTIIVDGLEPGRRYHFSIQTCFDGTGGLSGCYLPETHRAAYTAPKAPLFLSVNYARDDEINLSWEGGNTLGLPRPPHQTSVPGLDFYDRFECVYQEFVPGVNTVANDCSDTLSDQAKTVTVDSIDPEKAYKFRVRHKERNYNTRVTIRNVNYDVAGTYEAGPWREVTVGRKPPAPTTVRVSRTGNSATVEWDAVLETYNGTFVGNVSYLVAHYIPADCPSTSSSCPNYAKPKWATSTTGTTATVSRLRSNETYAFSVLSRTEHRIGKSSGWVGEGETSGSDTSQARRETIVQQYDANEDGSISQAEMVAAIDDFYNGNGGITYEQLQELIDFYDSQSE